MMSLRTNRCSHHGTEHLCGFSWVCWRRCWITADVDGCVSPLRGQSRHMQMRDLLFVSAIPCDQYQLKQKITSKAYCAWASTWSTRSSRLCSVCVHVSHSHPRSPASRCRVASFLVEFGGPDGLLRFLAAAYVHPLSAQTTHTTLAPPYQDCSVSRHHLEPGPGPGRSP